jgi:hypothetical protein
MSTRIDTIEKLNNILIQPPVMVEQISPVSLAFLPEMPRILTSATEMICVIEAPDPIPNQPMIALQAEPQFAHRFPTISCQHKPIYAGT